MVITIHWDSGLASVLVDADVDMNYTNGVGRHDDTIGYDCVVIDRNGFALWWQEEGAELGHGHWPNYGHN